ncbi:CobQ/CobB/MinD/ParA nucleotide binding domain-containing protein [Leptolyngbya sp. PCC 6406]|uniref:CobQ/CobB/MinD/ParA nucleotide binding domain-containing protein n=1 Tax=Leptolyngbya sp. PCC 6406 TaxID=1173264 RepID=UPI0002ABAE4A|nr:CobQ/CobB/MinD/ParA nucleotide binding domain-containing protein [Leptolyngbya sp. PCC 6406]
MPSIIALHACRHAAGCSHLAANLAVLLMQQGQRVGLLDTDPRGGGIRVLFGLDETAVQVPGTYSWLQLDPAQPRVMQAQTLNYGTAPQRRQPGIYMVPTLPQPGGISAHLLDLQHHYSVSTPSEALSQLQRDLHLTCLIFDTQPTLDDDSLLSLALADTVVLMLQIDTYDFQRTAVILEVLKKLGDRDIWLVPSQVLPDLVEDEVKQKVESTYNLPVGVILPLSEQMVQLASGGIFCLHYPDHPLTQAMATLAQAVTPPSSASGLARILAKPFGKSQGKPFFGILDLSPLQRQVLMAVIRRGALPPAEVLAQVEGDPHAVSVALQELIDRGWLFQDNVQGTVYYQSPLPDRDSL